MNTAPSVGLGPKAPLFGFSLALGLSWLLLTVFFLAVPSPAAATPLTPEQLEQNTHEISESILSPFCPGRSLNDCPSSAATDLRHNIKKMLSEGKSKEEVYQHLYTLYGYEIRAVPPLEGFGMVGWLMPAVFLMVGLMVLMTWLARNREPEEGSTFRPLDPELQARVDAELLRDRADG